MLRIGTVTVDPPLILAPMAGVTDRDFRLIVRRIGGVGLVTMEFIQAKGLVLEDRRVLRLLHFEECERPISIQIYGSRPDLMAEAARIVESIGADVCDINMGCPANKVLKGCAGAALMGDLKLAERIVHTVRRAIQIPLTVKFRIGVDDQRKSFLELGRICQAEGADAVAMHARTAKQMYRGAADWSAIGQLKRALDIPVLGNGDIKGPADALRMLEETGCDGVMVGRGATSNPWIFKQIAAALQSGRVAEATLEERRRLIVDHFRTVIERDERGLALHKLRTFTNWYSRGLPGGLALRRQLGTVGAAAEVLAAVEAHFAALEHEAA